MILLGIAFVIIVPSLVLTIILGRKFNAFPDVYNKVENDPVDKYFAWVLACLCFGFLVLCGALFVYLSEKKTQAAVAAAPSNVASNGFIGR